jgi:hypothetical protein
MADPYGRRCLHFSLDTDQPSIEGRQNPPLPVFAVFQSAQITFAASSLSHSGQVIDFISQ